MPITHPLDLDVLRGERAGLEAIDLLCMTSGATDVRGAPIDPIARRVWGVPVEPGL